MNPSGQRLVLLFLLLPLLPVFAIAARAVYPGTVGNVIAALTLLVFLWLVSAAVRLRRNT